MGNIINGLPDPTIQQAWIVPTLLNSWVNFGASYSTVGYYKDDMGIVHLRGLIKSGTATAGAGLFVLPAGYRPAQTAAIAAMANNGSNIMFMLEVGSAGSVQIAGGNAAGNTYLCLDNIHFRAEL